MPGAGAALAHLLLQLGAALMIAEQNGQPLCNRIPTEAYYQTISFVLADFAQRSLTAAETYVLMT